MAVARMQKVTIIGHQADKQSVIESLQRLANVQIIDVHDDIEAQEAHAPVVIATHEAESRLQEVQASINFLDRFQKRQKSLIDSFVGSKVTLGAEQYRDAVTSFNYREFNRRVASIDQQLSLLRGTRQKLLALKEQLLPWAGLRVALEDLKDTLTTEVFAATALAEDVATAEALINHSGLRAEIYRISEAARQVFLVIVVAKGDKETAEALRGVPLSRVSFGDLKGTAASNLADIESELSRLDEEERRLLSEIKALQPEYHKLLALYDEISATLARSSVQVSFAHTERVFVIQGWVKAKEAESVRDELLRVSDALVVSFEDPGPADSPPVSLENSKLIEPFEMVTTIYGLPAYHETDPTPLLAPFFFVFFGLALSDAAYGIVLAIASLLFMNKLNIPWSQKKLFRLLVLCGISTLIFGSMLGSWFGNIYELIPGQSNFVRQIRQVMFVFDPIEQPLTMLMISVALGIVQVWFGILIKFRATMKSSGLTTALADQGTWLFFLGALVFMVLASAGALPAHLAPVASKSALAGAFFVMAGASRATKSWVAKPFVGLYGLYGLVGYFSDILSYTRLLALGLATGVIANVVNQMADLVRPVPYAGPIVMLAVLVVGHIFNLAINILGSFIHSGRLQFVEFFTKFFEGGGKAFRPFRREERYTAVRSQ